MKTIPVSLVAFLLLLQFSTPATARAWTSATDGTTVTIKKGAQTFTLPLSRFAQADQDFVKEQLEKASQPKPLEGPYTEKFTGEWVLAEHDGLPYAIYGAAELDGAKKYPVLLALHGKSQNDTNGKQVGGWMKTFASADNYAKRPCIIVAPLCYQPHGATGGGWDDEPGTKTIALMEDLLDNCPIVDEDRVYIFGYSMGGFGTTHLFAEEPKMFAAAIAVAGCTVGSADAFKRKPLWLFHAEDDATVEVSCSRNLHDALKRNDEVKYTEFDEGGHGIIGKVFNDPAVHEWLFSKKR